LHDRLPVDEPDQRAQGQVDKHHKHRRGRGVQWMAAACQEPDRSRTPQRCRGVEARHLKSLAKDDAGAEEADPRDDLRSHPRRTCLVRKQALEHDKARRADRNQRIGSQSRHPLAPLSFEADAGAEQRRHTKVEHGLTDRRDHGRIPVWSCGLGAWRKPAQKQAHRKSFAVLLNIARLHFRDQRGRPVSERSA
jgi:hypothetical protein